MSTQPSRPLDILERCKPGRAAPTAPGDFRLGDAAAAARAEGLVFTPYALDLPARAILEVGMPRVPVERPRAFFYLDQLDEAVAVRRTPLERYAPAPAPGPRPRRVLVFSIGRTGSTLVSQILAGAGIASISEPDILLHLSQRRTVDELALSPADWNRLYLACLAALETAHGAPATVAIKFRAQSSNRFHIRRLHGLLPEAKYVFLFRDVADWSRSFTGKFNFQAQTLKWLLMENLRAASLLQDLGADLRILRYEEIVRSPGIVLDGLLPPDRLQGIAGDLARIMQSDSQSGMFDKTPPAAAASEQAAFLDWWRANRPAALLDKLGLEL